MELLNLLLIFEQFLLELDDIAAYPVDFLHQL